VQQISYNGYIPSWQLFGKKQALPDRIKKDINETCANSKFVNCDFITGHPANNSLFLSVETNEKENKICQTSLRAMIFSSINFPRQ